MMTKSKIIFDEDVKEMWKSHTMFRRSKNTVIGVFTKNILPYSCDMDLVSFELFRIRLSVDTDELNADEEYKQACEQNFKELIEFLEEKRFYPAINNPADFECFVHIEHFVEAVLNAEKL